MMDPFEPTPVSQPSREMCIQQILDEHRSMAYEALDDLMYETFLAIGRLLAASGTPPERAVGGLSLYELRQILRHCEADDLADWLAAGADRDKSLYLRDFLNLGRLQMTELRSRYPRAFTKWTPEEDDSLLARYHQQTESGRQVSWSELASAFQRNPNALRLRLGQLGIDLGKDAGRPGRFGSRS